MDRPGVPDENGLQRDGDRRCHSKARRSYLCRSRTLNVTDDIDPTARLEYRSISTFEHEVDVEPDACDVGRCWIDMF